jgi:hypothetical protein
MWTVYEKLKEKRTFRILLLKSEEGVDTKEAKRAILKCKSMNEAYE